jgi:NAD(P)-dependent dehydrogenase (short-subunit alcohol dehydrogenase family)
MVSKPARRPICLVVGAGDALGGAIARRFAREGYLACVARRTADKLADLVASIEKTGGAAAAYGCDARREDQVVALFERIEKEHGPIDVLAHNIGGNVRESILDATAQKFFKTWEMACMAGFLTGREAARRMVPRGRGTILFTGATASLRGGIGFAGFSAGKAGLRMVAQSMARELGPKGIHVGHVVVDGAIDTAFIRENFPARYALKEREGILDPDHIADIYWMLHAQPRDAWSFEIDVRPWIESW